MPVPQRPTDGDKDAAVGRVQHRHRRDDNSDTHLLLSEDPADVLRYLRRRGVRALIGEGEHHDVTDALTLRLWLWWRGEADELWLLDAAETLRLSRRRLAAQLGVRTGQGVVDRREATRRRLAAGRHGDTGPPADPTLADRQERWLRDNARQLRSTGRALVEFWELAGDDEAATDWIAEVRADLRAGACTRSTYIVIDQAVQAMSEVPAVRGLPADHPLVCELARWREFAAGRPRG